MCMNTFTMGRGCGTGQNENVWLHPAINLCRDSASALIPDKGTLRTHASEARSSGPASPKSSPLLATLITGNVSARYLPELALGSGPDTHCRLLTGLPWQQPASPQVPCRNGRLQSFFPCWRIPRETKKLCALPSSACRFGPLRVRRSCVPALDLPSRPRWARVRKPKETSHGKYRHLQENRQ